MTGRRASPGAVGFISWIFEGNVLVACPTIISEVSKSFNLWLTIRKIFNKQF